MLSAEIPGAFKGRAKCSSRKGEVQLLSGHYSGSESLRAQLASGGTGELLLEKALGDPPPPKKYYCTYMREAFR